MLTDITHTLAECELAISDGRRALVFSGASRDFLPDFGVYILDSDGLPDGDAAALYEGDDFAAAWQATGFCGANKAAVFSI